MICDGRTAGYLVKEVPQSESQNMKCMKQFCSSFVELYEGELLRQPGISEICSIKERHRKLGFTGCIGAVEGASWYFKNYPVGWQGLFTGKEGST